MRALSVIIPTRDRPDTLRHTLQKLLAQDAVPGGAEILVIENGGAGETARVIADLRSTDAAGLALRMLSQPAPGPAAARNLGIAEAEGSVLLFLGDDTAPESHDLLRAHADAHASMGNRKAGVLGTIRWSDAHPTPLMRWLDTEIQFGFGSLAAGPVPIESHFYSSHVSIPASVVRELGGFDTRFTAAAMEDIELGWRLHGRGVELTYRPELVVEHDHPTSYRESLARMGRVGTAMAQLQQVHPEAVPVQRIKRAVWRMLGPALVPRFELAGLPSPAREWRWKAIHYAAINRGYREASAEACARRPQRSRPT